MRRKWSRVLALLLAVLLVQGTARAAEITAVTGTGVREQPEAEVTFSWDDAWFAGDACTYRHELSVAAMALSAAAYVRSGQGARDALKDAGFERIKSYNYHFSAQSRDRTAYTFAVKTVKDGAGKDVKLAAVVIRGTGVYTEWAGNLDVGTGPVHEGFAKACDELMNSLKAYLADVPGVTKFLVTGHSRGGAAANLTAAGLTDAGLAKKADVYAYTFAAPAVSTEAKSEGYENIFNIVNSEDLVTQVPLAKWGYSRFGVDKLLPSRDGEDFETAFAAMDRQYTSLTGRAYAVCQDGETAEKLTDALYRLAPTVSGPNMAMLSALLRGDLDELSALVEGNAAAALQMGRTAIQASSVLTPLLQREAPGLAAAHCMAGYFSWLTACRLA